MEVVNFRVGNRLVAFNILDILLTEKFVNDQTSVPSDDQSFLGVKDFMGRPTPIYDLGLAMNNISTQTQNNNVLQVLSEKEQAHEIWLDTLEESVKKEQKFTLTRDPKKCDLVQWYTQFTTSNQDLLDVLKRIEAPHRQLHALADKAIALTEQNNKAQAIKLIQQERIHTLASLKRLFSIARDQLAVTYKPVTVFTTTDGRTPALGFVVDKVEDSLHIEEEHIRPLKDIAPHIGNIDHRVKNMIDGLLTAGVQNSLLLSSKSFL
ncbi:CZB domain-containing protein [Catenovulum adriaticum]|uniref:CZB domain-containing protein n=1 Tax=Catenovulum adriaticum TaxID=2984846 RepID=A0ABY7APR4_9ALTE|nr:CZB domain-containing protein [Catenovulum sp. TS8]WAJ71121.1 CZB domain-containing protein [Catenovulum sp. TS8]